MTQTAGRVVSLGDLRTARDIDLSPDEAERSRIAERLGLDALRKLTFRGRLEPSGARDWTLKAELGATVVQPCVVTLAPVVTRIDEPVLRSYVADYVEPAGDGEVEMPEDVTIEPLPRAIDLGLIMEESLALSVPDFPRADGVELGDAVFTEPGRVAMTDDDAKPFAGLRGLRDKMSGDDEDDGGA